MTNGLRISVKYIYDRHETPACDEETRGDKFKAAKILLKMAEKAKKFIFISDDEDPRIISELVTGAWLYQDGREDWMEDWMIRTAYRIKRRWEQKS